jgi:TatD DNase family protein
VDIGCNIEHSKNAIANAEAGSWCYAAVGFHPHDAEIFTDADLTVLKEMIKHPKVVAVGEIGLDYFRDYSPRDLQRDVFRKQLRVALEAEFPIIIHNRDSGADMIDILKEEGAFSEARRKVFPPNPGTGNPDLRIVMHCFSGSAEQALEYVKLGCTISIAGPVTYKNNKKTVRVAAWTPLSDMVIETDSPYLTPEPFRGKRNEPAFVEYTARKIAEIRGVSYEEIAAATLSNAKRVFGI